MWREERRLWHRHHHNAGGIRVESSSQSLLVNFVVVVLLGSISTLPSGNAFCVQPLSSTTSTFHRRLELERSFLQDTNLVVVGERRSRSSMPAPTHLLANSEPMQVEEDGNRDDDVVVVVKPLVEPNTHDELMYALGVNLARQLGDVRPLVESPEELTQVAKGLLDTVIGRVTEETQKELLVRRGKELNALITDRANSIRERLERTGRQMLKEMSEREGTQTLESGVVLHVLEPGPEGFGQGVRPTKSSTVKIHYHGTLPDGTAFDSTLNGEPVVFPLAQVIPGWRDGVLKMHEGETAMLGIPPEQAYGAEGTPDGRIPGGSTLFFKVQLLEVMTAGIGGSPNLLGADGKKITTKGDATSGGGLLGPDGRPM